MFLALDLETTGLDPRHDKIIEVAAMRITKDGEILEVFHKLIHPGVPIPHIITHLTGITNEAVEGAPSFGEIREELAAFIGDLPILGHSVMFDIEFLRANGITANGPVLDTFQLAQILLPQEPSYSLEILSEKYELPHANKHRADDDTRVAVELYKLLLEKIREIPEETMEKIQPLLQKSEWGWKEVFQKTEGTTGGGISLRQTAESLNEKRGKGVGNRHDSFEAIPELRLAGFERSETNGARYSGRPPLEWANRGAEKESGDFQLSSTLFELLTTNRSALIESPNYTPHDILLAATQMAEQTGEHVLIATPRPQAFPADARVTHLQNPNRYLNDEVFNTFVQKPSFTNAEIRLALKIILWRDQALDYTFETGLRYELTLNDDEYRLWDRLSAHAQIYKDHEPHESTLYGKAYKHAKYTPVLIVHSGLLIENLVRKAPLIPPKTHLILDEIETLADTALTTLTQVFSVEQFWSEDGDLNNTASVLFGLFALLYEKNPLEDAYTRDLILEPKHLETAEGSKIRDLLKKMEEKLNPSNAPLSPLHHHFAAFQKALALNEAILTWITLTQKGDALVKACPRNLGALLKQELWDKTQNVIGLSAYGTYHGTFEFIKKELNLPSDLPEIISPSLPPLKTINYQLKTYLDLPNPKRSENLPATVHAIEKTLEETQKNGGIKEKPSIFVLTSSFTATEQLHEILITPACEAGYLLLTQGMSGGLQKIAQRFATEQGPCFLIGTEKLWNVILEAPPTAGQKNKVSISSKHLTPKTIETVFLHRLPFAMPWHPVAKALANKKRNPFTENILPRSIIRFKKILHDLSTKIDAKTLHILDPRFEDYDREFAKAAG